MKTYKDEIVDSAIEGLVEGGMEKVFAENLRTLLERVYQFGYNEANRNNVDILQL